MHCFSEKKYIRKKWLSHHLKICKKHKVPFENIPNINVNTRAVLNWGYIEKYCIARSKQPQKYVLYSLLGNLDNPFGTEFYGVNLFFEWRISLLKRYGMLSKSQEEELLYAFRFAPDKQFSSMFKILKKSAVGSSKRLFYMLYWSIVDPIIELADYLKDNNDWIMTSYHSFDPILYADFYKSHFIELYADSERLILCSNIEKRNEYKDLDIFDPGLILSERLEQYEKSCSNNEQVESLLIDGEEFYNLLLKSAL